jgi:hypothetical protein
MPASIGAASGVSALAFSCTVISVLPSWSTSVTVVIESRAGVPSGPAAVDAITSLDGGSNSVYVPHSGYSAPSGPCITIENAPPCLASASARATPKPSGAYHFIRCSPSVQALNTRSAGASIIRVNVTSAVTSVIVLLLPLQRAQVLVEAVEPLLP